MARDIMGTWQRAAPLVTVIAGAIAVDVLLGACATSTTPAPPKPPEPQRLTVTISATGVAPSTFTGPRATVEFVNRDTEAHDIRSDPHPGHDRCPELNLGRIDPGQTVSILTPFESGRACGYHDETRPDDVRFQGSITIS